MTGISMTAVYSLIKKGKYQVPVKAPINRSGNLFELERFETAVVEGGFDEQISRFAYRDIGHIKVQELAISVPAKILQDDCL